MFAYQQVVAEEAIVVEELVADVLVLATLARTLTRSEEGVELNYARGIVMILQLQSYALNVQSKTVISDSVVFMFCI